MTFIDNLKILTGKMKSAPLPPKPAGKPGPHKVILIVEDEKVLAETLASEFKSAGFDVIKAENGQQGLELIKAEKPDLIVLDLLMPIMDGKVMLRKVREIPQLKKIPVIVLTNAGDIENIRETQTYYSAEEFMIKSNVHTEDIINRARDLLGIVRVINPT